MTCWLCGFETRGLVTDEKEPMCKNGPCGICVEVDKVNEEIDQALATLQRLLAKRCDLRSEHNRVHGTLMNRLPVELKNHIFKLLLPSRDEWGSISPSERTAMPWFLATISVCRGWRDVALSNPFLWSTMHIPLGKSSSYSRINDCVLRSGTLPLTLHIHGENEEERSSRVLLDVMSHCSNRLQSLSLYVPFPISCSSQHNNFQYHRLTRLQIIRSRDILNQPLSLLNPTASPETIKLCGVPLRSLQISWHRLTSADVRHFEMDDVAQLFQYASQMTGCQISSIMCGLDGFSMPSIIHHKLKTLDLRSESNWTVPLTLLESLTLPCLQEFCTDDVVLLARLPALVRRSSCPFTKLIVSHRFRRLWPLEALQPLAGVTDLVVEYLTSSGLIEELLLKGYFPDLRHLTLRLEPFQVLWPIGAIRLLLDHFRPRLDEGLLKFLVIDQKFKSVSDFDHMWSSGVGEQLGALNIGLRDDGFEFL